MNITETPNFSILQVFESCSLAVYQVILISRVVSLVVAWLLRDLRKMLAKMCIYAYTLPATLFLLFLTHMMIARVSFEC